MGSEALRWAGRHGCNSGSAHVVNAEIDSMGGVVDGGVGIGLKTSPCRVAIEKAQAELRQEYDVREERRRELKFLEKGGNPLDFKLGNAVSVRVQSTSLTDQHQEQFVTSEAKGSFVLTASPHGDSVDSSARPGTPSISEPNTADNLLLFDGGINIGESGTTAKNEHAAGYVNHSGSGSIIKNEDFHMNSSSMQNKLKDSSSIRGHHNNDCTVLKADKGESVVMIDRSNSTKDDNFERLLGSKDVSISTNPQSTLADKVTTAASDCQPCSPHHLKFADKAHEDSILEGARIIEVKRKRIMELSAPILPSPILRKSPWDFVLEEMAWLANDFAQERLWKTTAASVLAKAVMQFWHSVELLLDKDGPDHNCIVGAIESEKVDSNEASRDKWKNSEMESSNCLEGQNGKKIFGFKVHSYAMRYMMDSRSSHGISSQAEAHASSDKVSDSGTVDMSREENLTENSRCAKYRLPDVHEEEKPTTSGQHAGGNDAGFEVGERSSTNKCCNICWKGVEEIVKYGLFPGCDHVFCHACISRWRCNGSASWKITKSCPICRTFSFFVIPSTKWLAGEAKATHIKSYMQRCSSIDCRFFSHGDGYCPQRHHCFYRHVVHPGTYRWMHHRSPPPPQPEVDEEVAPADDEMAADTITDFEIGIRPEAKDQIIHGTIPPSCISCSFFFFSFFLILKLVSDPRIE